MRKSAKRITFLILVATLIIMSVACTKVENKPKEAEVPKEPITLTIWNYYTGAQKNAFDELVQEFNKTEGSTKNIVVKAVSQSSVSELFKELVSSAKGNVDAQKMPDMFTGYRDTVIEVEAITPLANLDKLFTKDELDKIHAPFLLEGRMGADNALKLYPIAKSTELLIINKPFWDDFAKAKGATYEQLKTWEGLIEVSKLYYEYTDSLSDKKNDGKAFYGRDSVANFIYCASNQLNHPITKIENGKEVIELDKEALQKVWDNYYTPFVNGYFFSFGKFASDDMKVGDIIAMVASSSSIPYLSNKLSINDKEVEASYDILPMPNFKDSKPMCIQQGAGIAVIAGAPEREAASATFLKWFTNTENNLSFTLKASYVPVNKEALNIDKITEFAKNNNIKMNNYMIKALGVAINQMQNYELYFTESVKNGFQIRKALENTLKEFSNEDSKLVKDKITSGLSREQAIKEVISLNRFEEWHKINNMTITNLSK